ncbi:uncharacterized protein LOC120293810 [Eucalyptus grandis]|uniref:uncharacterized protein LOC120293810 n=1 Tax=Eucalyptus grandis TaxID=71139 RepID=UPI00192EFBA2|nr:uncharacterized protein LOC120293810 [Eucalyptus grandis]
MYQRSQPRILFFSSPPTTPKGRFSSFHFFPAAECFLLLRNPTPVKPQTHRSKLLTAPSLHPRCCSSTKCCPLLVSSVLRFLRSQQPAAPTEEEACPPPLRFASNLPASQQQHTPKPSVDPSPSARSHPRTTPHSPSSPASPQLQPRTSSFRVDFLSSSSELAGQFQARSVTCWRRPFGTCRASSRSRRFDPSGFRIKSPLTYFLLNRGLEGGLAEPLSHWLLYNNFQVLKWYWWRIKALESVKVESERSMFMSY